MTSFVPGAALARACYDELLAPMLTVPHAAGLLGGGSDVLGYDTPRSTDHDWGPRALVLVSAADVEPVRAVVYSALPEVFHGWPMRFGRDGVPPHRHVEVTSLGAWIRERLGHDPLRDAMSAVDWLALPQQRVLEVVAGPVFRDDTGELSRLRRLLAWYPEDVWWWLLAAQWRAVAEEEAFVQRTAEVGDRLGSAVEAARLVRLAMRLALLLARRYAPYPKWLGTAFARLDDPEGLGEVLTRAVAGGPVSEVEASLGRGWQILATRFNQLTAGPGLDTSLRPFHDRPAIVIGADRFVAAALNRVRDPKLLALPLTGAIDQVVDNVAVLTSPDQARRLRGLWEPVG